MAGNLATSESKTVAAIVPTLANSIFAEMLQGMMEVLDGAGYQLILGSNSYDPLEEEKLVRAFLARQVEGMILTGANRSPGTARLLQRAAIPVVETWSLLGSPSVGSVGFSNYQAAYAMVQHLHTRGYRRLGFVSAPIGDNDRAAERRRGFVDAVRELNHERRSDAMLTSVFSLRAGADALDTILQRRPDTDAIFFANDTLAAGAILQANRRTLQIPRGGRHRRLRRPRDRESGSARPHHGANPSARARHQGRRNGARQPGGRKRWSAPGGPRIRAGGQR
ncbi:MAG: substrate-binding domain-containing protein [Trueperaceae bacterium]|nr:substrate-binding domain-containing protein [Trueperaceae bacterium]